MLSSNKKTTRETIFLRLEAHRRAIAKQDLYRYVWLSFFLHSLWVRVLSSF